VYNYNVQCTRTTCRRRLHVHVQQPFPGVYFWDISRLYFTCVPPVSHRILGIPRYPCIYLYLAICSRSTVSRCIPLYHAVSVRNQLYTPQLYLLYPACNLTVSHRLENGIYGHIWPKIHSRGGLTTKLTNKTITTTVLTTINY